MPKEFKVDYKGMGTAFSIDFQKDKTVYKNDLDFVYPIQRTLTYNKDNSSQSSFCLNLKILAKLKLF